MLLLLAIMLQSGGLNGNTVISQSVQSREKAAVFLHSRVNTISINCKLHLSEETLLRRIRESLKGVAKKGRSYIEADDA